MTRALAVAVLALAFAGGAAARVATEPRNLTPPKLYGEFVAGRPVTVDPGRWSGSPTFQYIWERCTPDGSICKLASDLGDEHATTVRPKGEQGADVGVRLKAGVTADHAVTLVWTALSPVITAGVRPRIERKGGIDPYTPPRVGMLLQPYFVWDAAPRSVTYRWQRCGVTTCVDIGVTKLDYRVRPADFGSRLRIVSTAVSGGGTASASLTTKPAR
jgi:hypothetical protein